MTKVSWEDKPLTCPKCKSTSVEITDGFIECMDCDHRW